MRTCAQKACKDINNNTSYWGSFSSGDADKICREMGAVIIDDEGSEDSFNPNRTATFLDGSELQITCSDVYL